MGRLFVVLGAIFMISGVLLASSYNASQNKRTPLEISKTKNEWSVSAYLEKDDKIAVELRYGSDWPTGYFDPYDSNIGLLYVYVDVQDPLGNATEFEVVFRPVSETLSLVFWSINVTRQNGLDTTRLFNATTKTYAGIGGIVKNSGLYNVTVTEIFPPRKDPPASLTILKETKVTEHPYTSFLPGGLVLGVSGAILSFIGLRNAKRKTSLKKRLARIHQRILR